MKAYRMPQTNNMLFLLYSWIPQYKTKSLISTAGNPIISISVMLIVILWRGQSLNLCTQAAFCIENALIFYLEVGERTSYSV